MTDAEEKADKAASKNLEDTRAEQGEKKDSSVSRDEAAVLTDETTRAAVTKSSKSTERKPRRVLSERHIVGGGETDTVSLAAIEYKSLRTRKSLSVHHLQRRLAELGYGEAAADLDGAYGDLTFRAVAEFQADEGIDTDEPGIIDQATLDVLFEGDANVTLKP